MSHSDYKEESSIPSEDGPANNCNLLTLPAGQQADADTVRPADVAVEKLLLLQVELFVQRVLLEVLLQAQVELLQGVQDKAMEAVDMGMRVVISPRGGDHQPGRSNYSISELEHMIKSTHEILPISGLKWNLGAVHHATFYIDFNHASNQIKKQIIKLARTMIPTGNQYISVTVQKTKEIFDLTVEKTEGATGSEENTFFPEDVKKS